MLVCIGTILRIIHNYSKDAIFVSGLHSPAQSYTPCWRSPLLIPSSWSSLIFLQVEKFHLCSHWTSQWVYKMLVFWQGVKECMQSGFCLELFPLEVLLKNCSLLISAVALCELLACNAHQDSLPFIHKEPQFGNDFYSFSPFGMYIPFNIQVSAPTFS